MEAVSPRAVEMSIRFLTCLPTAYERMSNASLRQNSFRQIHLM